MLVRLSSDLRCHVSYVSASWRRRSPENVVNRVYASRARPARPARPARLQDCKTCRPARPARPADCKTCKPARPARDNVTSIIMMV